MLRFRPIMAMLMHLAALMLAAPALAAPNHIVAGLVAEGPAQPGGTVMLAITMKPEPGWHGYWLNPGDAGKGMDTRWTLPSGVTAGPLQYPVPQPLLISGLMNHVYEHDYAVLVSLAIPTGLAMGTRLPVQVHAEWLVCSAVLCVPERDDLALELIVGPPGQRDPRFDGWRQALPAPLNAPASFALSPQGLRLAIPLPASVALDSPHLFLGTDRVIDYAAPQRFSRVGDKLVVELARAKFLPEQASRVSGVLKLNQTGDGVSFEGVPGPVPTGGTPLAPTGKSVPLGWLLLSAMLGGLLLNVMPCVFPILSLKALSLVRAGESEAQARAEGWAYAAGVIVACLALGGVMLALRAAGQQIGWAFQLQEPVVVAALLLLATAITANLAGLYELAVPGFAGAGSPRGAFATGLLAAFAATPCTGPFMAAAMGAALLLPTGPALALFAALGFGLALPFLAVAEVPALRRLLPRPGPWMVWFRKAMAVPMAATAVALVWLESRLGGWTFALTSLSFVLGIVGALFAVGARQRRGVSALAPAASAALLAGAALLALPTLVRTPAAEAAGVLPSQPFSEAALASARASGKPVFAFFTADWCLTCKVNESAAIERADTARTFAKAGVVVLRGDWTRRDPAITRFLTAQGAAGVPLYLWYPAGGGASQQLPQVLTPAMLQDLAR